MPHCARQLGAHPVFSGSLSHGGTVLYVLPRMLKHQMDITEWKLNEETHRLWLVVAEQRRLEAEEVKRQQELHIDITW
jgi:hypothetical protein